MKLPYLLATTLFLALTINACKQEKKTASETPGEEAAETAQVAEIPVIALEKLEGSPAYSNAVLQLDAPKQPKIANGTGIGFDFKIENYALGAQTDGLNAQLLANSGKGQHIHFILDNQPYSAHYEPNFEKEIPDGTHHLVAFLSRSYHESVKNENSVVVQKLEVGSNPVDSLGLDMTAPTLIYSRPKGTYVGKDAENVMLDFFVLNTTLSENGHKVRATVNGRSFTITEWAPQLLKGLPMGEVTIMLELIDGEGNLLPGPFNKVTRTVMLQE